jgi:hypothetical protein
MKINPSYDISMAKYHHINPGIHVRFVTTAYTGQFPLNDVVLVLFQLGEMQSAQEFAQPLPALSFEQISSI